MRHNSVIKPSLTAAIARSIEPKLADKLDTIISSALPAGTLATRVSTDDADIIITATAREGYSVLQAHNIAKPQVLNSPVLLSPEEQGQHYVKLSAIASGNNSMATTY